MHFIAKLSCGYYLYKELIIKNQLCLNATLKFCCNVSSPSVGKIGFFGCSRHLSSNVSLLKTQSLPIKKRPLKKKKLTDLEENGFRISAFSTAEEYVLETLLDALPKFKNFATIKSESVNVVHAVEKSTSETETRDYFFFQEGALVVWNVPENEIKKILHFLKPFEENSFNSVIVEDEREDLTYHFVPDKHKTVIVQDKVIFSESSDLALEKYAISNAMALSVHLGTYEATLDEFIDTIEPVTKDLRMGRRIKMSRKEVLRKTGELFTLRHHINLNSDLLDTPDFYWDREDLENLYQTTFNYFCINKRTKVINERISHCIELVELLSSNLNDQHHIRLEWMIIVLIMVEVAFEILHFLNKNVISQKNQYDYNSLK